MYHEPTVDAYVISFTWIICSVRASKARNFGSFVENDGGRRLSSSCGMKLVVSSTLDFALFSSRTP